MPRKITFKQAVKQTLNRHRVKVDNYICDEYEDMSECGFCDFDDARTTMNDECCAKCPTFIVENRTCDSLSRGISNCKVEGFCSSDNEERLTNVLARMMYLHTFAVDDFGTYYDSSEEDIIEEVY